MYRARMVFGGPEDREYVFYSAPKTRLEDVVQMIDVMRPVLLHTTSITVQTSNKPGCYGRFQQMAYEEWCHLLPHVSVDAKPEYVGCNDDCPSCLAVDGDPA